MKLEHDSDEVSNAVDENTEVVTEDTTTGNENPPASECIDKVEGVEENVASRFVDYTMATPYERLIADIERTIKSWIKPKGILVIIANYS
jgi:hypothetical protein